MNVIYEIEEHDFGKSVYCAPTISTPNIATQNITESGTNNSSENPLELDIIVAKIFKSLPFVDLLNAKAVNSDWYDLAKMEIKQRDTLEWIVYSNRPKFQLSHSQNYKFTNATMCIIAYDARVLGCKSSKICLHSTTNNKLPFLEYVKEIVPPDVRYVTLGCSAVYSLNGQKDLYKGLLIPKIPNIQIDMFTYNKAKKKTNVPIGFCEDVRCIIMLPQRFSNPGMKALLRDLLHGSVDDYIAFGGGLLKNSQVHQSTDSQNKHSATDTHTIVFWEKETVGDSQFNAHSLVITSEESLENRITEFKSKIKLRKNGLIFRMCCYAKIITTEENDLLFKHFPNYTILGMDVDGEIGWNTSMEPEPLFPSISRVKRARYDLTNDYSELWHGWTTILVFILWGREVTA